MKDCLQKFYYKLLLCFKTKNNLKYHLILKYNIFLRCEKFLCIDFAIFWDFLTAISTFGLLLLTILIVVFAKGQLDASNNAAQLNLEIVSADFSLRIKRDFFTEKTRELLILFDNNLLIFKSLVNTEDKVNFRYFIIDKSKLDKYSEIKNLMANRERIIYSEYEITDLLLNHFEDLGIYEGKKIISEDTIYEGFSTYIRAIYENDQIQKYIFELRNSDPENLDIFDKFETIYKKMKNYAKKNS